MPFKIYPQNIIIIAIILLPNLLFMFFPPINLPKDSAKPAGWNLVTMFEGVGRLGLCLCVFFYRFKIDGRGKYFILLCMLICVGVYYVEWLKYILEGRDYSLLFKPLGFIPVPMAVFPVIYFILAGVLLNSWPMIGFSIIFGITHVMESYRNYQLTI